MLPARLAPHALAYAAYYATVGVLLPYLSAFFESRGFDARKIGILLSFSPLLATFTPLVVGYLADKLGRPRALMRLALVGATTAMFALAGTTSFAAAMAVMLLYAAFHPPILVLLEAATIHELEQRGGSYARVRMFGSVAFVVASFGLGMALDHLRDDRTRALGWVPIAAAIALLVQLAATLVLPARPRIERAVDPRAALALLSLPGLPLLLFASMLHWIAMAPYHTLYAVHVHQLGLADGVVGASMALGATAEIAVMALSARIDGRFSARTMLIVAFASGAVRWVACALVTSGAALIAIQLLHGLSFGAFYLAAIATLRRIVPVELRATGQGLFIASVFGLGGAIGTWVAGQAAVWGGGQAAFFASAIISLAVTVIWARYSSSGVQS